MHILTFDDVVESFKKFRKSFPNLRNYAISLSEFDFDPGVMCLNIEQISSCAVLSGTYNGKYTFGQLFKEKPEYAMFQLDKISFFSDLSELDFHYFLRLCFLLWRYVEPELFCDVTSATNPYVCGGDDFCVLKEAAASLSSSSGSVQRSFGDVERASVHRKLNSGHHVAECQATLNHFRTLVPWYCRWYSEGTQRELSQLKRETAGLSLKVNVVMQGSSKLDSYLRALLSLLSKRGLIQDQEMYDLAQRVYTGQCPAFSYSISPGSLYLG